MVSRHVENTICAPHVMSLISIGTRQLFSFWLLVIVGLCLSLNPSCSHLGFFFHASLFLFYFCTKKKKIVRSFNIQLWLTYMFRKNLCLKVNYRDAAALWFTLNSHHSSELQMTCLQMGVWGNNYDRFHRGVRRGPLLLIIITCAVWLHSKHSLEFSCVLYLHSLMAISRAVRATIKARWHLAKIALFGSRDNVCEDEENTSDRQRKSEWKNY